MEQKGFLLSALGVGVGVGVGLGLASNQTVGKWSGNSSSSNAVTAEKMEQEMLRQVVNGRESKVTFDQFPYYLRSHFAVPFSLSVLFCFFDRQRFSYFRKTEKISPISDASRTEACVSVTRRIKNPHFFILLFPPIKDIEYCVLSENRKK